LNMAETGGRHGTSHAGIDNACGARIGRGRPGMERAKALDDWSKCTN
jgi:hypothetical protein